MKAQTSIGKLYIGWKYDVVDKEIGVRNGKEIVVQDCTSCIIQDNNKNDISIGITKRYFKDIPNKALARKQSFINAISTFSRDDRRILWNEYKKSIKLI